MKWSRARRPSTSIGARLCCSARSSAARRTRRASASTCIRETPDKDAGTKDFIALSSLLLGETKKKPKLAGAPDPLLAAMTLKAGMKPKDAQSAPPPKVAGLAAAAATARDAGLPLNVRIESGEQAFAGGLLSADELIGLYRQVKFTGDPLTMPDSPMMRAQLYQAADQAFDPVRRAQFVQRALANARARATYFVQGALYRPIADKVHAVAQPRLVRAGGRAPHVLVRQCRTRRLLAQPRAGRGAVQPGGGARAARLADPGGDGGPHRQLRLPIR